MTDLAPFVVHVAGAPSPEYLQRCVLCGTVLTDNSAWLEGRVAIPVGQPDDGPGWWPAGALIATDKQPGGLSSCTYTVEAGRPLDDDERTCTPAATHCQRCGRRVDMDDGGSCRCG